MNHCNGQCSCCHMVNECDDGASYSLLIGALKSISVAILIAVVLAITMLASRAIAAPTKQDRIASARAEAYQYEACTAACFRECRK